jgi:hypothetical protein
MSRHFPVAPGRARAHVVPGVGRPSSIAMHLRAPAPDATSGRQHRARSAPIGHAPQVLAWLEKTVSLVLLPRFRWRSWRHRNIPTLDHREARGSSCRGTIASAGPQLDALLWWRGPSSILAWEAPVSASARSNTLAFSALVTLAVSGARRGLTCANIRSAGRHDAAAIARLVGLSRQFEKSDRSRRRARPGRAMSCHPGFRCWLMRAREGARVDGDAAA